MIRLCDLVLSFLGLTLLSPLLLVVWILCLFDTGAPLFRQIRVGRYQCPFELVKFRTMRLETMSVASHLVDASAVTPLGRLLRRSKLDELPQLINVLSGDMSMVGPRPCLFNQTDLIAKRAAQGVFNYRPGITGLAQIQGIDMSTPAKLAETDRQMLQNLDLLAYFRYILLTLAGRGLGDRVKSSRSG